MDEHNYYNTFISVAEDYPSDEAKVPAERAGKRTVAQIQYELLSDSPFEHTQEDVLFESWKQRQPDLVDATKSEIADARAKFFAKPQPCMRASPLTKTHGWGVAFDENGRAEICAIGSAEYDMYMNDPELKELKAMRSKRK